MSNSTWSINAASEPDSYHDAGNWSLGVPTIGDTAFFGKSNTTSISIGAGEEVGGWTFNPGASQYNFFLNNNFFNFDGEGIIINGGGLKIDNLGHLEFFNNSTAGSASIKNENQVIFFDGSTAGNAIITNENTTTFTNPHFIILDAGVIFLSNSTAGNATIETISGATTVFEDFSTGGNARLIADGGGLVDFSLSSGPNGDGRLSVGSIEGPGTYDLGADQLTVGGNERPATASGPIDDGGFGGGSGARLVKVGHGELTLSHAFNTYSGGTGLDAGTLELAAVQAAGIGAITFAPGSHATLKIDNAALPGHVFGNEIDFFGKHDVIDLSGLHFQPGAFATFHHQRLKVHSGGKADTLKLLSPHGTHFTVANDGRGGSKVTLEQLPPVTSLPAAAVAHSVAGHDHAAQHWATDTAGSAGYPGDFLFVA